VTALGLDLGGTFIKWALVESDRVLASGQEPTLASNGPAAVVERLGEIGRRILDRHGPVEAAGVGVPGLFDARSGAVVFLPNLPGEWDGVPVTGPLEEALGVPVSLINDARAFTLAEWKLGAARGCSDAAFMVVGTGVGGGLVLGGSLYLGAHGTAGELGHQTIDPDGPACGCGNRGCIEAYAAAPGIAAAAGMGSVTAAAAAAEAGDEQARAAFRRAGRALGIGFANMTLALSPERCVIGGGLVRCGELLLEPLRCELARRVCFGPRAPLVVGELGPLAGAVGAAVSASA
jgi:glucokinase